ncbi:MAG TPA: hypothetical protein VM537_29410, partial [Anaerolineae bacterium]|nr:hypothetical protein [Anaerolineae bacterium]
LGDQTVPVDPAMWKPQGDLVATKAGDQPQPGADFSNTGVGGKTAPPDVVGRILNSDVINEATGAFDVQRWLGTLGYGPKGDEVQDVQRDMGTVLIQGMAANLETMEAKPVSDFESRMAQLPVPDANTQPYGWVAWSANTYRPAAEREMNMAIAETRAAGQEEKAAAQEAKRDEILLNSDKNTVRAALKHGYPLKDLVKAGVDPELIEYLQDLKEQGKL